MASSAPRNAGSGAAAAWPGFVDVLTRPLALHSFLALTALLVAAVTAYCVVYCLVAFTPMHGAMMPVHLSAVWAFSAVVPWVICFELVKRARVLPPLPQVAAVGAAFIGAGLLSIALELGFGRMLGGTGALNLPMELAHLFPRVAVTALLTIIARSIPMIRDEKDEEAAADGLHALLDSAAQIEWIRAAGNYAEVHGGGRTMLHRVTMRSLERSLDPARFVRIHRQLIVNSDFVESCSAANGGRSLRMKDGTLLRIGDRYAGNWPAQR